MACIKDRLSEYGRILDAESHTLRRVHSGFPAVHLDFLFLQVHAEKGLCQHEYKDNPQNTYRVSHSIA